MSKCLTNSDELDLKAFIAASVKVEFGHMMRILTGGPFLLMGISPKTWRASLDSEDGESSTTGISTWNLGWLSFLSTFTARKVLLRGFSKAAERQVLAWRMASSLVVGGVVGEEREDWMERESGFVL